MKRLLAMAIVLLASSAAQAQYQFEYGGRTIRIDPDRGTVSIPGVYDNSGRRSKRAKSNDQDISHGKSAPQDAKADPQAAPPPAPAPAPAPADTAAAPPPEPPAAPPAPPPPAAAPVTTQPPTTTANNAPADTAVLPPPPAPPPPAPIPPAQQQDAVRQPAPPPLPPAPTVAAAPAQVTPPAAPAVQRPHDPNSPVGVWLTEEKEGKVRIEQCGANLCGYSVDAKSNANGEQVLINMKPGKDQKWSGRILDPNSGSTYDSTITLRGTDRLRVQGCAFGGMFCGGQTWTRVN